MITEGIGSERSGWVWIGVERMGLDRSGKDGNGMERKGCMTQTEILGYTKRRVLLRHKVSKGNCQRCGLPSKERYRLATKCLCRKCVEQAFERKIEK